MSDTVKFLNRAKIFKNTFYLASVIILVASFSTAFWVKTEGLVTASIIYKHSNGYAANRIQHGKFGRYGGSFQWPNVSYQFVHNYKTYTNSTMCICLPIGITPPTKGQSISVYYLPFFPSISVLQTGPHFIFSFFLAFLGGAAHLLEILLLKYAKQHA